MQQPPQASRNQLRRQHAERVCEIVLAYDFADAHRFRRKDIRGEESLLEARSATQRREDRPRVLRRTAARLLFGPNCTPIGASAELVLA